jgi:5-methyltetrahydrofolate--homocysteine methyltransferase
VFSSSSETIRQASLREKVKIIVGGAPVTQHDADEIGADALAADASRAVGAACQLLAG